MPEPSGLSVYAGNREPAARSVNWGSRTILARQNLAYRLYPLNNEQLTT